jgi:signal peptidase II
MKQKNQILLTIIVLLCNLVPDRITKLLAISQLQGEENISFLYNTIILKYVENTGAFLSVGSNWPDSLKYIALIIIPLLICIYGLYYCAFKLKDKNQLIIIVSILSGGIGNLIDRLFYNFHVVDFLNFGIGSFRTGILNVADMSVTFGVMFLVIYTLRNKTSNLI